MPHKKQPKYRQKEHLNMFGEYFQEICDLLGTSWEQVGRKAGVDPSTIHNWCTGEEPNPKRETLEKIYMVMREMPRWIDTYKHHLFVLADRSTAELKAESKRYTDYLKYSNKVKYPDRLLLKPEEEDKPEGQ